MVKYGHLFTTTWQTLNLDTSKDGEIINLKHITIDWLQLVTTRIKFIYIYNN